MKERNCRDERAKEKATTPVSREFERDREKDREINSRGGCSIREGTAWLLDPKEVIPNEEDEEEVEEEGKEDWRGEE